MNQIDNGTIHYRDELVRKLIHLFSLSIPIIYYFISRKEGIIILSIMTFISLLAEALRYYAPSFNVFFTSAFGFLLRKHEVDSKRKNLTGATYVFISALICIIVFPKLIFITAFSILIISDIMAALIGRRYGRHKFLAKSLEGTLAFFVSAIIVVFLTPKFLGLPEEYFIAVFASAVGAIAENISFGFADDNLSVPLSVGLTMLGLYSLFLPQVKLFLF